MHISRVIIAKNNAALSYHALRRLLIEDGKATVMVDSYKDSSDTEIRWRDQYPVPLVALASGDPMRAAADHLVTEDAPFSGGRVIGPGTDELEIAKAQRWQYIKDSRSRANAVPVEVAGLEGKFQTDLASRVKLAEERALFDGGVIDWTTADNLHVTLDSDEIGGVLSAISEQSKMLHAHSQELREQLLAAKTVEEVEAIFW